MHEKDGDGAVGDTMPARSGPSVAYSVTGSGDPVVLIHGLAASGRYWKPSIEPLARRFRVYAVDVPGFGGSRLNQPFSIESATRRIGEWIQGLADTPLHIVGHSMGGRIAAGVAVQHPNLIRRLVLVDTPAWALRTGALELLRRYAAMARYLPLGLLPRIAADVYRAGLPVIARASRILLNTDMPGAPDAIIAPTLVVWGANDHLVPLDVGRRLASQIPGAKLHVIARAGHNVMWNQPKAFNDLLCDFLTG